MNLSIYFVFQILNFSSQVGINERKNSFFCCSENLIFTLGPLEHPLPYKCYMLKKKKKTSEESAIPIHKHNFLISFSLYLQFSSFFFSLSHFFSAFSTLHFTFVSSIYLLIFFCNYFIYFQSLCHTHVIFISQLKKKNH